MNAQDIINTGNFRGFSIQKNASIFLIRVAPKRKIIELNPLEFSKLPNDFACFAIIQAIKQTTEKSIYHADLKAINECRLMGFSIEKIVGYASHYLLGSAQQIQRLDMLIVYAQNPDAKITLTEHAGKQRPN